MKKIITRKRPAGVKKQHQSGRGSVATTRSRDLKARLQTTTLKSDRGSFSVNDWYR
jgi:hypothetical protein